MDKYVEIQKVFSNLYISKIGPYIENFNRTRRRERKVVLLCLSVIVLFLALAIGFFVFRYNTVVPDKYGSRGFIFDCWWFIGLILFIVFAYFYAWWVQLGISSRHHLGNRDKELKELVFSEATEQLKPYVDIKWSNSGHKLKGEDFYYMMDSHQVLKINNKAFKLDDIFEGKFQGINYEIYEVVNRFSGHIFGKIGGEKIIVFGVILLYGIIMVAMFYGLMTIVYDIAKIMLYMSWSVLIAVFLFIMVKKLFLDNSGWFAKKYSNMGFLDRFKGLIVRFKLNKQAEAHIVILENHEENLFLKSFKHNYYKKVELEDVEFNKKFTVYAINEVDARYVLTPAMMDRLLNLKQSFNSKYIRASFRKDELVIAIQSDKDLFGLASIWWEIDSKDYQTMFMELISILKITDALNLQNNTGL